MPVRFTIHALKRLKSRDIEKKDILDTINNPTNVKKNSQETLIAQKIKGKHLLRVFYFLDGDEKVVISAYKTSQIKKYL